MIDARSLSTHLASPRRDLYRLRRHDALRSCGTGTGILAGREEALPMGAVIVMDPALRPPDDTGYLVVAGALTHRLRIGCNTVGRQRDNDLVIRDDELLVSRRHCEIVIHSDGRAEIFDTASLNGTFVNGRRVVDRARLRSNDIVQLGGRASLSIVLYNPFGN